MFSIISYAEPGIDPLTMKMMKSDDECDDECDGCDECDDGCCCFTNRQRDNARLVNLTGSKEDLSPSCGVTQRRGYEEGVDRDDVDNLR